MTIHASSTTVYGKRGRVAGPGMIRWLGKDEGGAAAVSFDASGIGRSATAAVPWPEEKVTTS